MPATHKIGAAISGPRIAGGNFVDITLFLNWLFPVPVLGAFALTRKQYWWEEHFEKYANIMCNCLKNVLLSWRFRGHEIASKLRTVILRELFLTLKSGVAPANQTKEGPKGKVHEFRTFLWILVFFLRKQARFTLNFSSGMPPWKVHELTFLWFGLPGLLLMKRSKRFKPALKRPNQHLTEGLGEPGLKETMLFS